MNAMMSALFVDATRVQTERRNRAHETKAASRRRRLTARRIPR